MWPAFHLPAFNGEGDVDEWISKLECFFNTVAIHEDSHKILYAANYLTGPAHAKWRALHHQDGAATTTWEDFKNLILRCFKPCAAGDDAATPKEEQPPSAPKKDVKLHFVVYYGDDDFGKWLRGRVNGHTVSFVASNSSDNFVSESTVSRLGTGNLVAPKLEFEIDGGYMGRMDFAVMKFSRHDFVLGHSFFGNNFQMFATELRVESDGYVYSFTLHSDPPCSVI